MAAKILLLDIETAPTLAYVWRLYDENIGVEQIVKPTRMICWAAKWVGQREMIFGSEWMPGGREAMLAGIHALLAEADAVVTYNGDKFDLPKLMGEFAMAKRSSPGPLTSIDLYKTARKLGLQSSRLAFVAPALGIGEKIKHEGFRLWLQVEAGDERARKRMERYNKQDTRLLEKLYTRLRPFIRNHPYLGSVERGHCPSCESHRLQKRGTRRTKAFVIERLQCQSCGSWTDGVRRKVV
jgi:hypothetical protein